MNRQIYVDGVKYQTIKIAADAIGTSTSSIYYALRNGGHFKHHSIADHLPAKAKSDRLLPNAVTHRLGSYLGGSW